MTTESITDIPSVPASFEDAEAVLASALPGYESRPQQRSLAIAIERAMDNGTHLIAEAGCGTGKSFATAIPAILSGKRVVMSTATKALQNQIADKDLPFLAEHLGVDFTFALLKGRSNYLCQAQLLADEAETVVAIDRIRSRAADLDFDGERDSLGFAVEDREWRTLTVSSEECPGRKTCPYGDECFAEEAKRRALHADIVVVNHALLLTDLMIKEVTGGAGSMLGDYDFAVIDEAHELEEYAVNVFSQRYTEGGMRAYATEVKNFANAHLDPDSQLPYLADDLSAATNELWSVLTDGRLKVAQILENADQWVEMANVLTAMADVFEETPGPLTDSNKIRGRFEILASRARRYATNFVDIVASAEDEVVRWVETEKTHRGQDRKTIKSAPVSIAPVLNQVLFSHTPSALVSATMAVAGEFDYIAGRLGVEDFDSLDVGSPFDFETQARLYIPTHLPEPSGSTREAWANLAIQEMLDLVRATEGRALLLFTSVSQMRRAYDMMAHRLDFTCYMQGQAPNRDLAAMFKEDTHSVLFATRSFFTGVDFPGETLSLVIIDKLPFPVPTEPLFEARCEKIEADGGNSFSDYTIPVMSLVLAQGFGRLIRTREDRGVVAILDPRLETKGYARKILRSLPDSPRIHSVSDVQEFFA